ncbi:MAG: hypothetical protein F6K14_10650 [Symploca sp. SIO2C1]|nr:hypothetical protein [Symploca sp. SIO2C1]
MNLLISILAIISTFSVSAFGQELPNQEYINDKDYQESLIRANIIRENYPSLFSNLQPCPCTIDEAEADEHFEEGSSLFLDGYHPGAVTEYRTRAQDVGVVEPIGAGAGNLPPLRPGQQCTYSEDGYLITHGPGAGTPDAYSPSVTDNFDGVHPDIEIRLRSHTFWDVDTFDPNGHSTPFTTRRLALEPKYNRIEGLPWYIYFQTWTPNNGNNCYPNPTGLSIYVQVDLQDTNGSNWDTWITEAPEPEIIVCIEDKKNCYKGDSDQYTFYRNCPIENLDYILNKKIIYFWINDYDQHVPFRPFELIGEGKCEEERFCRVGKSWVLFRYDGRPYEF